MFWIIAFATLIGVSALLCIKRPGIAIGLLICMFGIESVLQNRSVYFVDNGRYVNFGVVGVLLFAVAVSFFKNPSNFFKIGRIQVLSLALYALGFLSFWWSLAPSEYSRWYTAAPYIITYCVLAPALTRQQGVLRDGFISALMIGVPLLLFMTFYCDWGIRGLLLAKPVITNGRVVTETQPLAIATLASSMAILAIVMHLKIPLSGFFRISVWTLGLLVAFMTESRGQVVAIIGVSAIVYPISSRANNAKGLFITIVGISIFGLIVFLLINNLETTFRWRGDRVENDLIGRSAMWTNMFFKWLSEPGFTWLFGLGAASSFAVVGFYPHNLFVEILCELGLIGIGIYLYILAYSAKNCLTLLSRLSSHPKLRGTVISLIGILGVNFALSLKEGSLYLWPVLFFYLICLQQQVDLTSAQIKQQKWLRNLFIISPNASMSDRRKFTARPIN